MNIKAIKFAPTRVAFMRHIGLYMESGSAWDRLFDLVSSHKELKTKTDLVYYAISHDNPEDIDEHKLRYDLCVGIDAELVLPAYVQSKTIAEQDYAVVAGLGSMDQSSAVYRYVYDNCLSKLGREVDHAQACLEKYANFSPDLAFDRIEAEIMLPLK